MVSVRFDEFRKGVKPTGDKGGMSQDLGFQIHHTTPAYSGRGGFLQISNFEHHGHVLSEKDGEIKELFVK